MLGEQSGDWHSSPVVGTLDARHVVGLSDLEGVGSSSPLLARISENLWSAVCVCR